MGKKYYKTEIINILLNELKKMNNVNYCLKHSINLLLEILETLNTINNSYISKKELLIIFKDNTEKKAFLIALID